MPRSGPELRKNERVAAAFLVRAVVAGEKDDGVVVDPQLRSRWKMRPMSRSMRVIMAAWFFCGCGQGSLE